MNPIPPKLILMCDKLIEKEVVNLSDAEITRAFGGCVGCDNLIQSAKEFRERGELTMQFLRDYCPACANEWGKDDGDECEVCGRILPVWPT